jgi:Reverse transcriptase (RNA-dependent DNA polymerase)
MKEVAKLKAKAKVNSALNQRNGPNVLPLLNAPVNSKVLIYREDKGWKGPYRLQSVDPRYAMVDTLKGRIIKMAVTSVKLFKEPTPNLELSAVPTPNLELSAVPTPNLESSEIPTPNFKLRPSVQVMVPPASDFNLDEYPLMDPEPDYQYHLDSGDTIFKIASNGFDESRRKEMQGLWDSQTIAIADDVPPGIRIFGSRFVDVIKNEGTEKAFEKSRLVVQGYNDKDKVSILTQAPTIQRCSQRMILCAALIRENTGVYLRDISQAYTQSETQIGRPIYIRAPKEMNLPPGTILKCQKPLYGVPEAGNHWYGTYHRHHVNKLGLQASLHDPCLLFNDEAIVGLQTDDSLIVGTPAFMDLERKELEKAKFLAKPVAQLTPEKPLEFNGFHIDEIDGRYRITQEKHTRRIRPLTKNFTKSDYIAQRALGAYIATVTQPEASFCLSSAAQTTDPTWEDAKALNACLTKQQANKALHIVPLNPSKLRLVAYCDASFANNRDLSSQLGYIIALSDSENANILAWQSVKCRRVTRSVLASELYALSLVFDIASTLKATADQLFSGSCQGKGIPLVIATDSKSLYDCLTKLGTTKEKRLMIDVACLRQAYERREIAEIVWIKGEANPADAMTKDKKVNDALARLVETNKLHVEPESWVER